MFTVHGTRQHGPELALTADTDREALDALGELVAAEWRDCVIDAVPERREPAGQPPEDREADDAVRQAADLEEKLAERDVDDHELEL